MYVFVSVQDFATTRLSSKPTLVLLFVVFPLVWRRLGTFSDEHALYYVIELALGGELLQRLPATAGTDPPLSEDHTAFYVACISTFPAKNSESYFTCCSRQKPNTKKNPSVEILQNVLN